MFTNFKAKCIFQNEAQEKATLPLIKDLLQFQGHGNKKLS